MTDCLFCKIIAGEIPSTKIYEDENVYAFPDINPLAPVHILVVPKKHIASLDEAMEEDKELLANCLMACKMIAAMQGLSNGYRVVTNCGPDSGQTVQHLHFHILGGQRLNDYMA